MVWSLNWPFLWVVDGNGQPTGWALLNGPIVSPDHQEQFARLRWAGIRLAGISSYLGFPRVDEGDMMDYEGACEAWCHCFREPDSYLATGIPRALISISDFTDYQQVDPASKVLGKPAIRADFVYVAGTQDWHRQRKNWTLAVRCIPRLCEELGLRCLVVGAPVPDLSPSSQVSFSPPLPWHNFLATVAAARFLFVPNQLDASPRIIAEALCLDVPVIVNANILGGWKYVNRFTGALFTGEDDVIDAASACLIRWTNPRAWFRANYGPGLASDRLLRLLRSVDPRLSSLERVRLASRCAGPTAAT